MLSPGRSESVDIAILSATFAKLRRQYLIKYSKVLAKKFEDELLPKNLSFI